VRTELDRRALLTVLAIRQDCEARRSQVREVLSASYDVTPGDPRFCVRRLEVVEYVARALGIAVLNNAVFADVEAAASAQGFQAVKNGNRSLFRCVKRRDHDHETALAVSGANRRDARWTGDAETRRTVRLPTGRRFPLPRLEPLSVAR
jgi:hypothetical protein